MSQVFKTRTNGALAFDLSSLIGTAVDVNSGNKSAGTLRVVFATDQPANTNAFLVTGTGGSFPVTDSGGSLTIDNAALSVVGGGAEATALRVTIASDSTGVLSIDDNGGNISIDDGGNSITVDNGGTFAVQAAQSGTWNITNVSGTISLPTGASTSANQTTIIGHVDGIETLLGTIDADTSGIITAVQLLDDAVFTAGTDTYTEATSKGIAILAVRRDADTTLANTTNEFVPLQVDAAGKLKVEVFSGETLPVSLTSTTITGTVAVTQSGTWDEVGINDSGNSITVDNGGTFAVQDSTVATNTGNAATSLGVMDDWDNAASDGASVSGDTAHDAVDAGEPVKVGHRAIAHGANPAAVAAADRSNWYANRHGIPWVIGGHPNIISREVTVADADGAQTNAAFVTVSAGSKIVVTRVSIIASNANSGTVAVRVGFGTATLGAEALAGVNGILVSHPGIAPGSGVIEGNGSGIIGVGADDEDIRFTCDDPAGGSIKILCSYYTIES